MRTLARLPSLRVARRRLDSRASWASASVGATVSKFAEISVVMAFVLRLVARRDSSTSSKRTQYSKYSKYSKSPRAALLDATGQSSRKVWPGGGKERNRKGVIHLFRSQKG